MIQINKVSKNYNSNNALNHISLEIKKGEIIGLLGPNGSGKTTLIKIITGLINDYEGEVTVNGNPIGPESKARISYLSDTYNLSKFNHISDCLDYYEDFFEDFNREKTIGLLRDFQLSPELEVKSLSRGMMEKFHLAMTLGRDAHYYVLDEPISGVDIISRDEILEAIIQNINPTSSMIISTHLVDDIETILDRVIYLKNGQVAENVLSESLRDEKGLSIIDRYKEIFGRIVNE